MKRGAGRLRKPGGGVPTSPTLWVLPNGAPDLCPSAYWCWEPGCPVASLPRERPGSSGGEAEASRGGLAQAGVPSTWLGLLHVAAGAPSSRCQPGAVAAVPPLAWSRVRGGGDGCRLCLGTRVPALKRAQPRWGQRQEAGGPESPRAGCTAPSVPVGAQGCEGEAGLGAPPACQP